MLWLWLAFLAVAVYVHRRCIAALGPTPVDNTVVLTEPSQPPSDGQRLVEPLPRAPLVVILGWGGSTRKQLRRIIEFCSCQLQAPVLSYINPMISFLHGTLDRGCMEQLLRTIDGQIKLQASGAQQTPGFVIFVHSNNGAFVYGDLKAEISNPSSPFRHLLPSLRGVIFDSAPAVFDPAGHTDRAPSLLASAWNSVYSAFRFSFPSVAIVLKKPVYAHPFWTPAITLWAIGYKLVTVAAATLQNRPADLQAHYATSRQVLAKQLRKDVPQVPHMFLYSAGDRLLQSKYVEAYISFLRSTCPNLPITTHDFRNTGHVQHFLKAPQEYASLVRSFVAGL